MLTATERQLEFNGGLRAGRERRSPTARHLICWCWGLFTLAALILLMAEAPAQAQCAMCRTAVENAADATNLANTLNTAILVLLIPPVTIMSSIFCLAIRYTRIFAGPDQPEAAEQGPTPITDHNLPASI